MSSVARSVLAGLLYFAVVFGAGAVLGTARVLWVAPATGAAELAEIPLMLVLAVLAARWIVLRMGLATGQRLAMGLLGLALMLACEFTVVLAARGLTLERYFMTFDPVSGSAYYAALLVFTLVPLWFEPRERALA